MTHDETTVPEAVERFGNRVRAVARSHRLQPQDVDDVVQTTWLRLIENRDGIRDPDALGAWLMTTARRASLRVIERSRRECLVPEGHEPSHPVGDAIDERLLARERRVAVSRAVAELPDRHRRLVSLLASDRGPSYAEIAAELDIPLGSIGPTRGRCIERLRHSRELDAVRRA